MERVAAFYLDVLGLTEMARHLRPDGSLRSIWLALPENGFLAVEAAESPQPARRPQGAPGWGVVAFRIERDQRSGALDELARRGIAVEHQSRWTLYFRDPEGNRVALSHHPFDPLSGE